MWLLLQIKKFTKQHLFACISSGVVTLHVLIIVISLYYAQKNSLQRFVLNAPKVYGTVVLMPMQKKVARKKTVHGQSDQARKVISYNQYKAQKHKKSAQTKKTVAQKKSGSVKTKPAVAVQTVQKLLAATSLVSVVQAKKNVAMQKKSDAKSAKKTDKKDGAAQAVQKNIAYAVEFTMPLDADDVQAPPAPPTKKSLLSEKVEVDTREHDTVQQEKSEPVIAEKIVPSGYQDDGIDMTGGLLGDEELGDPVQMGRDELVALELQEAITDAIQLVWFPPIGLSRSCAGSVQLTTDAYGHVTAVTTVKKSTSVAYDIAARNAIANAVFEDVRLHHKTFIVELGNDE